MFWYYIHKVWKTVLRTLWFKKLENKKKSNHSPQNVYVCKQTHILVSLGFPCKALRLRKLTGALLKPVGNFEGETLQASAVFKFSLQISRK